MKKTIKSYLRWLFNIKIKIDKSWVGVKIKSTYIPDEYNPIDNSILLF